MNRTIRALALSSALVVLAAACGGEASVSVDTASASTTAVDVTTASADPATRIVSLSPSATEMLFAIGAGDAVVAVDEMSNFPPEALDKQTDLSGFTPNAEAIAAYEPDLVVHDGTTDLGEQLDALGIPHWVGAAASSFDDIYVQIEQLGAATGRIDEADALVASMRAEIDAAIAALPELDEPLTFFHELDPTLYSVTSNTFVGQVYALLGLRNIADGAEADTDYPQLGAEFVISKSPDLIFLADTKCCGESPQTVAARPGWDAITAVAAGQIIPLDDDVASRWGPRVVELIDVIAAAVADAALVAAG
jgi:iron complex transport system substrate-binding protein